MIGRWQNSDRSFQYFLYPLDHNCANACRWKRFVKQKCLLNGMGPQSVQKLIKFTKSMYSGRQTQLSAPSETALRSWIIRRNEHRAALVRFAQSCLPPQWCLAVPPCSSYTIGYHLNGGCPDFLILYRQQSGFLLKQRLPRASASS